MSFTALVKAVLSADTLVLRSKVATAGQIPKERTLRLEGLSSPRVGSRDRPDEDFAYDAREFLRALVIGKEISFTITNTVSSANPPLEFGIATFKTEGGELDLALEVVKAGWASVREARSSEESEDMRYESLKQAEEAAKKANIGIWGSPVARSVNHQMPVASEFLGKYKGTALDCIVEAVPNGSTIRARLLLSPTEHQVIALAFAGVKAPRASGGTSSGEEFGDEARFFVESRLLNRQIKVVLLGLPAVTVAPTSFVAASSTEEAAPPPPPPFFLGTVHHPAGNIAALLLSTGAAKVVDWHVGLISQSSNPQIMAEFRKAEADAKAGRRGLWSHLPAPAPSAAAEQAKQAKERNWDGVVVRVWGADLLSIVKVGETEERRIQLASVRQPKPTDPKLSGLQAEGKEYLRKRLIGKQVRVTVDYIKPAEAGFEERECVTLKISNGMNVAGALVERGYVSVIRHRQGDEDRSSEYDKLLASEAKAEAEKKGIHSGKDFPLPRVVDASDSHAKAMQFAASLKRSGRIPAIVEFVAAGSRFKVFIPKQDLKLTLVLSGVRAPRTARNASEKSEAYGVESSTFTSRQCLQRDVEIVIENVDKSGGFIGRLYLAKEDFALKLVQEGYAKVDEYASDRSDLLAAEAVAKKAKKNIWTNYNLEAEEAAAKSQEQLEARKEYVDILVSDVPSSQTTPFTFSVQILQNGTIPSLTKLMSDLTLHHKSETTSTIFAPRAGDQVSARFTVDNQWYRAKIKRSNPTSKEAEVVYIDYGNSETIPFHRLRPLAAQFKSLPPQSQDASLSFVNLVGFDTEYGYDAQDRFKELTEGPMIANIDAREGNKLIVSLFDPKDPASLKSHDSSLNVQLVREGYALIDKGSRLKAAYPSVFKTMSDASDEAKRNRAGAYELGDIFED